ncbi:hypothetical protein FISHEDRAFT_74391 [Fistulina hepatica ATCC 64428]|uniref:Uncharacterized protein n=1 Tax=Fistulina hepatica ATCC 64428 TaxID=1128425 RepID=A0A0D7AAL4_9AGAR|nr:hypothetical protein FISHEDRAFT_74391 [Fistulina hepatica ATCC 64428]
MGNAQSQSANGHHYPTVEDIEAVRTMMQGCLPIELIEQILDLAEYWIRETYERDLAFRISASKSWAYLMTAPLSDRRVKKVKFITNSHDQGWVSDPSAHKEGTYHGAFSWFEVAIIREKSSESADFSECSHPGWTRTVKERPVRLSSIDDPEPDLRETRPDGTPDSSVVAEPVDKWELQRNVVASDKTHEHEIEWTSTSGLDPNADHSSENNGGKGHGRNFVTTLRPGDRIVVIGRALSSLPDPDLRDTNPDVVPDLSAIRSTVARGAFEPFGTWEL